MNCHSCFKTKWETLSSLVIYNALWCDFWVFCYVIVMVIHQYEVTGEKMDTKYVLTYLVSVFFSCHLILVVQVAVISMWPAAVVLVLGFSMLPSYKYLLYTLLVYCHHTLTQYIFWFLVGGHGSREKLVMWQLLCGPGTTCRRGGLSSVILKLRRDLHARLCCALVQEVILYFFFPE